MSEIRNAQGSLCAVVATPKQEVLPLKIFLLQEIEEELTFETTAQRDERILSYLYEEELKSDAKARAEKRFKRIMRTLKHNSGEVHLGRTPGCSANKVLKVAKEPTFKFRECEDDEPSYCKAVFNV